MKKIAEFFKTHRYAFIWTLCYVFAMKFILKFLFNFDMFSTTAWVRLSHSHLHGFGGLVFGLLVLAALPMYIATTTLIIRNKKPLFSIPIPGFVKRAFAPPPPAPEETADTTPAAAAPENEDYKFNKEIPTELHGAFIRARRGGIRPQVSVFDTSHIANMTPVPVTPANETIPMADDFPLPTDFDFPADETPQDEGFPSFTEINFDTPSAPETPNAPDTPSEPDNSGIIAQLEQKGLSPKSDGEFIIAGENLIALHTDTDFWIADEVDWFASGKQRPSPVTAVLKRGAELNLKPTLYLGATNILDLDEQIAQWTAKGVRVIKDLSEL